MPHCLLDVPKKGLTKFRWEKSTPEKKVIDKILSEMDYENIQRQRGRISAWGPMDRLAVRGRMLDDPVRNADWLARASTLEQILSAFRHPQSVGSGRRPKLSHWTHVTIRIT